MWAAWFTRYHLEVGRSTYTVARPGSQPSATDVRWICHIVRQKLMFASSPDNDIGASNVGHISPPSVRLGSGASPALSPPSVPHVAPSSRSGFCVGVEGKYGKQRILPVPSTPLTTGAHVDPVVRLFPFLIPTVASRHLIDSQPRAAAAAIRRRPNDVASQSASAPRSGTLIDHRFFFRKTENGRRSRLKKM